MKRLAVLAAMILVLAVTGCKSIANIISPPPEDIAAVKAAVGKQGEALDLSFALHQKSMRQMYDEGLKRSNAEVSQAAGYETLKAILAKVAAPLPALTADEISAINAQADKFRAAAKDAWDKALAAGDEPRAWSDLRDVTSILNKYILTRMGAEEQKNDIVTDVHDLVTRKSGN